MVNLQNAQKQKKECICCYSQFHHSSSWCVSSSFSLFSLYVYSPNIYSCIFCFSSYRHKKFSILLNHLIKAILMVAKHSTALSTIKSASRVVEMIKNLPEVQETWVQSLRWEDPLEKGMATHSSTLAWRIPWTEEPGGLQSMGWQRVRHD